MKGLRIVSTGSALPDKIVTNDDLSKIVDTNDEWISSRTGIKERRISEHEKNYELATAAARKAIQRGSVNAEQIGVVIVATISPDYMMPSTACLVQRELGLPDEVMAFDLSAACSGFLYALKTAKGLLENLNKPYALVIGSEQVSKILDFTDRSTCVLFGDGAGAAIVQLSDEHLYFQKAWSRGDEQVLLCSGPGREKTHITMEGKAVYKFAVTAVKQAMDAVLDEAQMSLEDIDYVVCHQANARIIEHVRKKYQAPENKFYMNLSHYANTSAASIPIALDEMMEQGLLKEGTRILTVGFGGGLTWSCALLTF